MGLLSSAAIVQLAPMAKNNNNLGEIETTAANNPSKSMAEMNMNLQNYGAIAEGAAVLPTLR